MRIWLFVYWKISSSLILTTWRTRTDTSPSRLKFLAKILMLNQDLVQMKKMIMKRRKVIDPLSVLFYTVNSRFVFQSQKWKQASRRGRKPIWSIYVVSFIWQSWTLWTMKKPCTSFLKLRYRRVRTQEKTTHHLWLPLRTGKSSRKMYSHDVWGFARFRFSHRSTSTSSCWCWLFM